MAADSLASFTGAGPPPDPPERPERAPRAAAVWPAWFAPAAIIGGIAATFTITLPLAIVALAGGLDMESPGLMIAMVVLQDVVFIGVSWLLARSVGPVRVRDFGFRTARFWRSFRWAAAMGVLYVIFAATYNSIVKIKEDTVPFDLKADESDLAMVMFALIAVLVAPLFEEAFFRGFVFKSLTARFSMLQAALIAGVIFGAVHWDFDTANRLLVIPQLAFLGVLLCWLYAATGSLYTTIGLHATNNAVAVLVFAVDQDSTVGIGVGIGAWTMMMLFVLFGARWTDRPPAVVTVRTDM